MFLVGMTATFAVIAGRCVGIDPSRTGLERFLDNMLHSYLGMFSELMEGWHFLFVLVVPVFGFIMLSKLFFALMNKLEE